jgi:hypothetical protein
VRTVILITEVIALLLGGIALIFAADRRAAARARPGDAVITAVSTVDGYPDDGTAQVVVVIANPGTIPVLAGLSPRPRRWPGRGTCTAVPSRTTRRRYLADRQDSLTAVPPLSVRRLPVLIPAGRRCRVAVVIGQPDGRLQVISVPVITRRLRLPAGPGPVAPSSYLPFPWTPW